MDYGTLADSAETRAVMDAIINECFAVSRDFYEKLLPPTGDHRPSMLRDIERGRRTEIEALNGMIVRYGRREGIPTPVNEMISHLVRFRETRR